MKKIVLAVFLLIMASNLFAQDPGPSKVTAPASLTVPTPDPAPKPSEKGDPFFDHFSLLAETGMDIPDQNFGQGNDPVGPGWGVGLGYFLDDHWSMWLRGDFFIFPPSGPIVPYYPRVQDRPFETFLSGRYSFGNGDIHPYIAAGLGFMGSSFTLRDNEKTFYIPVYENFAVPALQASLGFQFPLQGGLSGFVEGKWNTYFIHQESIYSLYNNIDLTVMDFPINAGVVMDLGGDWISAGTKAPGRGYNFGLKGGITYANITRGSTIDFNEGPPPLQGFEAGLFGDLALNDFLTFQPEASLVLKGDQDPHYTFPYLEFPMLLKAKFLTINALTAHILAGPYFSFMMQGFYPTSPPLFTVGSGGPLTGHYNNFDFGLVFFGISLEEDHFVLDARVEQSLTDLYTGSSPITGPNPGSIGANGGTTDAVIVSMGYKFLEL